MDIIRKITQSLEPSLEALGYTLVLVRLTDAGRRKTLSVMAERRDGRPMGVDDCTEISRTASALLDVEDPIAGPYDLEVSSPGLDRPLTKLSDFERFAGHEAKCETLLPLDGRRRFRGVLQGVDKDNILLAMPEGKARIPFSAIRTAKLVLTDELAAQALKKKQHS